MEEIEKLVRRARDGDARAYGHLVRRLQSAALSRARHMLGDYHLAEDAVQEAFVAAYADLGTLREPAAFAGWLLRIVAHRCHRQLRRLPPPALALEKAVPAAGFGAASDPQEQAEARALRRRVEEAVARLPAPERRVFTLFYMDDLSHKDIAAVLGIAPSTANSRLYTSRERLRQELNPMGKTAFVHLHGLSEYSLGKGGARVEDRARRAAELGMPALALNETDTLFGAVRHVQACRAAGVRAVLGCRLGVRTEADGSFPVGLLVRDRTGYGNLVRLVSKAHLESPDGGVWVEAEDLRRYAAGLFCLSGGPEGEVSRLLADGNAARAAAVAATYQEIFASAYYLEVQRQGTAAEERTNASLVALARQLDAPLVATHPFRFLRREDYAPAAGDKAAPLPSLYMKSAGEMAELFADLPAAVDNSAAIAAQCDFELRFDALQMPAFRVPEGFDGAEGYLRHLAAEGLGQRLADAPAEYGTRLAEELDAVCRTGFAPYFLIVGDYSRWARQQGVLVGPGRGSSPSSLLNYCLWITDIDPVVHGLEFSRFFNADRCSASAPGARPDIDIDLMPGGRERVMDYIVATYGEDCVSRVTAVGDFRLDRVLRQVGRALRVAEAQVEEVAAQVPEGATLEKAMEGSAALRRLAAAGGPPARLLEQALAIEGMAHRAWAQAGSLIVAPAELSHYVPLYRTADGYVATQYDARACEEIDLLKLDLLELAQLGDLDTARRSAGVELSAIALDDAATLEQLATGHNEGLLQLAGAAAAKNLRRLRPETFAQLRDLYTLHSPGPLQQMDAYIERRHGTEEAAPPHPALAPYVAETYGLLLYQEQLMQAVQGLAGLSGDEADTVRRYLPRGTAGGGLLRSPQPEETERQRCKFVAGCAARGMQEAEAAEVWAVLQRESVNLFNRSHAVAYTMIDYWLTYMRVHHP